MEICEKGMSPEEEGYVVEHAWGRARRAAKERDGHKCVTCGSDDRLEVNHIEPRLGKGYGVGCHNHSDNLETLCKPCHSRVTRKQRGEYRWGKLVQDTTTVDARRRINVGQWKSPHTNLYTVEIPEEGVIVLRPAVIVTDPEVVRGG